MKAKDYFDYFLNENQEKDSEWRLVHCLNKMVVEVYEISKIRNVTQDSAMISIFNEQNLKAISFIKMINKHLNRNFNKDLFKIIIQSNSPDLHDLIWGFSVNY